MLNNKNPNRFSGIRLSLSVGSTYVLKLQRLRLLQLTQAKYNAHDDYNINLFYNMKKYKITRTRHRMILASRRGLALIS